MDTSEMNRRAVWVLEEWDPFAVGEDLYAAEITEVMAQLHLLDHPSDLAKQIQSIYRSSSEKWIPLEKCVEVSYKLLALKYEAKCII
ncbi:DUF1871 family protein [Planococcus sp. FY231025]|uniref:DUF1871 family protein n=1 Tax=Planococcus sp. FY231025 TaxID=3455699 RepID=UPI003F8DC748